MCDITIENFEARFQEINANLHKANFVAIDTEFTGLHLENAQPSFKDNANERYKKLKKSVQTFNLVQVGLCTFRYCNEQKAYLCDTYNFYIFPRNYGFNTDLICTHQTSCIEFLCKYEFDFNKLFYQGIPYLNMMQEKQLETKLKKQLFFSGVERDIDEKKLQSICSNITSWLLKANEGEFYEIESCREIQDFVIHGELRGRFEPQIWTHQNGNTIFVEKVSPQKRREYEKSDSNQFKNSIDTLLGFTKIFRLMITYKKPIVVHNGIMDLMYFYEKFHNSLPDSIQEFKKKINELFPIIYDTKHISIECKKLNKEMKDMYDSTVLENLYASLNREISKKCFLFMPNIKQSPSSTYYNNNNTFRAHEAGFDAYACGTVFLKLAHALTHFENKNVYNLRAPNVNDYFLIMKQYENNVNLVKASLNYINLTGSDPACSGKIVLFVRSKKQIQTFELIKIFSSFGYSEVYINSKNTACVYLDTNCNLKKILSSFKNNDLYNVSLYSFWKHNSYAVPIISACAFVSVAVVLNFVAFRSK